jgi:hypothetical protein
VRVEGERTVTVRTVAEMEQLAALLEMHRQPPFLGASRAGQRLSDVACYEAELREGGEMREGWVVLRPGSVCFLPEDAARGVLEALTGSPLPPHFPLQLPWVVEQLRWLTDEEFDAHLARAVAATGGVRWSAGEARHAGQSPVWKEIRLTQGRAVLSGKVDWSQQAAAERVLSLWAHSPRGG